MRVKNNIELIKDNLNSVLWIKIGSKDELHFSYETICDFYESLELIKTVTKKEKLKHIAFISHNENVFSMGGDLKLFVKCVKEKNKELLKEYAYKCIKGIYAIHNRFDTDSKVTCILQGNAFGGGFECALSADYIIAEEHTKFSFPEALFGAFPGMGAFSFLTRKIGYNKASEMIYSTNKWGASQMKELNLITKIAPSNRGIETYLKFINETIQPDSKFSKICNQISLDELKEIVDLWLEKITSLEKNNILFIQKIVEAQNKTLASNL